MATKTTKKAGAKPSTKPEAAPARAEKGKVLKRKPKAAKEKPASAKAAPEEATKRATKAPAPVAGCLAALRKLFCSNLLTRGKSEGTARSYAADLKVAERHFGPDTPVANLTREEVESFMTSALVTLGRNGERKNQITIDKVLRVFRQALEHAVELGWIEASPMPAYERRSAKRAAEAVSATLEASDAQV